MFRIGIVLGASPKTLPLVGSTRHPSPFRYIGREGNKEFFKDAFS